MLQATTFDPARDHVAATLQLGFPCLQQVSFEPTPAGLVTNAFYATQQIFDKAYGNCSCRFTAARRLRRPRDRECHLARLNVMVGVVQLKTRITKSDADFPPLVTAAQALITLALALCGHLAAICTQQRRCSRNQIFKSKDPPSPP